MRTILFFTILFISTEACCQNKLLDDRNGFKIFTLGDNLSKWKSQVSYARKWEDNCISYAYIGNLERQLFDFTIKDIELKFYKDKLVGIYLTTNNFSKPYESTGINPGFDISNFKKLNNSLEVLFGKGVAVNESEERKGDFKNMWIGKTTLLMTQYDYLGLRIGGRAYVILLDQNFETLSRKSQF